MIPLHSMGPTMGAGAALAIPTEVELEACCRGCSTEVEVGVYTLSAMCRASPALRISFAIVPSHATVAPLSVDPYTILEAVSACRMPVPKLKLVGVQKKKVTRTGNEVEVTRRERPRAVVSDTTAITSHQLRYIDTESAVQNLITTNIPARRTTL